MPLQYNKLVHGKENKGYRYILASTYNNIKIHCYFLVHPRLDLFVFFCPDLLAQNTIASSSLLQPHVCFMFKGETNLTLHWV